MFRHEVRRVLAAEDLGQFNNSTKLLLLKPKHANVQVAYATYALALQDAECGGSIDVEAYSYDDAKVIGQCNAAECFARSLDDCNQFGLS